MNKPTLVLQAPVFSRSGYGDHSKDILRSLYKLDKYDIKIIPTKWGSTPQNQVDIDNEFDNWAASNVITSLTHKPDIFIQISVPNESKPIGEWNCLITAGAETTLIPKDFIDGCNRMDLTIVPSNFTKMVLESVAYQEKNKKTGEILREHKIVKPIVTLFEGVDIPTYSRKQKLSILDNPEVPDFNFLICGHWLKGELGQDRKDIGMTIKTIATTFQNVPKNKRPGIILKTSLAGFSVIEREIIRNRIDEVLKPFGKDRIPIHLLYGDLTNEEMGMLYNHPKVKAMVSFTKGEGYGRPLAEFALTGKPIVVSQWSGLLDFLPEKNVIFLKGSMTDVHESAVDKFILKEGKWFTVNYGEAATKLSHLFSNYNHYLERSKPLSSYIKKNFSLERMTEELGVILDKYVVKKPEIKEFKLPSLPKK